MVMKILKWFRIPAGSPPKFNHLQLLGSYEKAVSKLKQSVYTSDLATDVSDVEREKSRKMRFEFFTVYSIR